MKSIKNFAILLIIAVISFTACRIDAKAPPPKAPVPNPAANLEPAQNASGVWHYTCSKRCAGGAGAAGNCATCGSPLIHNAVYHGNSTTITPPTTSPGPYAAPPAATSAQNSAGVWHYSCNNGCAGGSGAAGNCSNCGGTLAHNQAYH